MIYLRRKGREEAKALVWPALILPRQRFEAEIVLMGEDKVPSCQ